VVYGKEKKQKLAVLRRSPSLLLIESYVLESIEDGSLLKLFDSPAGLNLALARNRRLSAKLRIPLTKIFDATRGLNKVRSAQLLARSTDTLALEFLKSKFQSGDAQDRYAAVRGIQSWRVSAEAIRSLLPHEHDVDPVVKVAVGNALKRFPSLEVLKIRNECGLSSRIRQPRAGSGARFRHSTLPQRERLDRDDLYPK
jgi:hypothetical protein